MKMQKGALKKLLVAAVASLLMVSSSYAEHLYQPFNGSWVINEELSDDTDKQVERAIKDGGGKVRRGKKTKGRYRGGPPSQKLYDHISYDETLSFHYQEPKFRLGYEQGFERVFYSDGRKQVVSAFGENTRKDYSFAGWEDGVLYVESKPLDAGYIMETYSLQDKGKRLRVEIQAEPATFMAPIKLVRIYDRGAR
jgi:hypothetical protein